MIYSDLVRKACNIAYAAHKNDMDKSGYPYVFHPFLLATQMPNENAVCVALLHDVIEDHGDQYSFAMLEKEGFNPEIITALKLLTHQDGVPYLDYVKALKDNPIARAVKIADLRHNMDTTRMGGQKTRKHGVYQEALAYLLANNNS